MAPTTTSIVTVLLARSNGAAVTTTALDRARLQADLAGIDLEHDDVTVHDISEGAVTRVNAKTIAVTYHLEVEAGDDIAGGLLEVVDEAVCFMPDDAWDMLRSTVTLA